MRDFIARYVAVNQRAASPTFVFGESYGTTRSAVLADLMLAAGMRLDGVILQSSALDYNSNCDVFAPASLSCEGFLPSYGETGAWHGLVQPPRRRCRRLWRCQLRGIRDLALRPRGRCLRRNAPAGACRPDRPARRADGRAGGGVGCQPRPRSGDVSPRPGARPAARPLRRAHRRQRPAARSPPAATPRRRSSRRPSLPRHGSSSNRNCSTSRARATRLLSNAIASWDFRHDGQALPDTIADLGAALARQAGPARAVALRLPRPGDAVSPDRARPGAPRRAADRLRTGLPGRPHDVSRRCVAAAPEGRRRRLRSGSADGAAGRCADAVGSACACERVRCRRFWQAFGDCRARLRLRRSTEARSRKAATPGCRLPCVSLLRRPRRTAPP